MILRTLAALAVLASFTTSTVAADLSVGDRAPVLDQVDWLQGEPVRSYEKGHVYVLDFWATWCGPCIQSIPHINELSKELAGDVTFIGVAIWPSEGMVPTNEFVADRGDEMSYTIAEDIEGKTAESFMAAAGRNGIPTAMIVDGEGTLVWMGHPMDGMDQVLEDVVAGEFDMEAYVAEQARKEALMAEANAKFREMMEAEQASDWATVERIAGEIAALDAMFSGMRVNRYRALVLLDRQEEAATLGREVVDGAEEGDANMLNGFAWSIVAPDSGFDEEQLDIELALMAAHKANKLTGGEQPAILDTLARACFVKGDVPGAIKYQTKAVELSSGPMKEQMSESLANYQAALG